MTASLTRTERIAALHQAANERILVLDGSRGVMIQRRGLTEADFRADRFVAANGYDEAHQMKGNNDILCITRPDIIADLHDQYFAAGADISETNTFSGTTIAQEDYALDAQAVWDINLEGAKLARAASTAASRIPRPCISRSRANSTMRIAFFADTPIVVMRPTCR